MDLDYNLKTNEERIALVNDIIAKEPILSNQQLSYLSDYLLFITDRNQTKKEKKNQHPIITKNRTVTVNKRQISYEGVVDSLETGENGLHQLIANDKNQILDPKEPITEEDIEIIPGLKEQIDIIESLQRQFKNATKEKRYSLKKQIIETWQQAYLLKASYKNAPSRSRVAKQLAHTSLPENITINPKTLMPQTDARISLLVPEHISFMLNYYSQLRQECFDDLLGDMHFLIMDLDNLITDAFKEDYPQYYDFVIWKIDGMSNADIREQYFIKYNELHSEQYYSTLWRQRIPKLLSDYMIKKWVVWHYTNEEYGRWLKCSKCGKHKLAHPLFFAKNSSSTGYYSVCKECKNKANRKS